MKTTKRILLLAAATALLAGCATDRHDYSGAMGNNREMGTTANLSDSLADESSPIPMGPNGSVGPGNPFGLGPGTGLDRAH